MSYPTLPPLNPGAPDTDVAILLGYLTQLQAWILLNIGGGAGQDLVAVDTRGGPVSYTLPDGAVTPLVALKDKYGMAHTNPITVYGMGVSLIDGQPSFLMNQNYGADTFWWNGDSWSVI